jgi:hypothetical protein
MPSGETKIKMGMTGRKLEEMGGGEVVGRQIDGCQITHIMWKCLTKNKMYEVSQSSEF